MAVWSVTNVVEITNYHRFDSEFFQPLYIQEENKVLSSFENKKLGELGDFLIGPFGSSFHVNNYDPTSPYRYIRGKDVKPFTLLDDDSVFMPEKDYKRLEKYAVITDDLLISVVGTLGNVAIVPDKVKGIFSCKSTVFRNCKVDPYYLLAYFNSKYGRDCLLRRQRGAIQTGLNKDDLKTVPVPIFPKEEKNIGDLIRKSLKLSENSKILYIQAQELLENEIGLTDLVLDKPKSYEASFSEIINFSRGDAEFHNPLLKMHYKKLSEKNTMIKINKLTKIMKFSNPDYSEKGIPIITQKHLDNIAPSNYQEDIYSTSEWYSKNPSAILKSNDLLYYSVGAYLGKTNIWFNKDLAVPASFITLLRPNTEKDAAYLMVLLNSKFGILQSKVFQSGTSQQYIYPKDIRKFLVPDVRDDIKEQLYNMLVSSYEAKIESDQLLEQAKRRVEALIEGGTGE